MCSEQKSIFIRPPTESCLVCVRWLVQANEGAVAHRLQLFADSFRDHQVKCVSHTPATPLIMHLDYVEFTQTLIHVNRQKD